MIRANASLSSGPTFINITTDDVDLTMSLLCGRIINRAFVTKINVFKAVSVLTADTSQPCSDLLT